MKTTSSDPIVDEVRRARHDHAAKFDYDITAIFRSLRLQQLASGRRYVRYPARRATAADLAGT